MIAKMNQKEKCDLGLLIMRKTDQSEKNATLVNFETVDEMFLSTDDRSRFYIGLENRSKASLLFHWSVSCPVCVIPSFGNTSLFWAIYKLCTAK